MNHLTTMTSLIIALVGMMSVILSIARYGGSAHTNDSVSCDFQRDRCEWESQEGLLYLERYIAVCGAMGDQNRCFLTIIFQFKPWFRGSVRSMQSLLRDLGAPVSVLEDVGKINNSFVLASERIKSFSSRQANDVVSGEIPLSMEHRCLRYKYLVIGNSSGLVVAYISNYLQPYDLSHILTSHTGSSVMKFHSSAVTLPIGVKFKVVYRALFASSSYIYGLILLDDISISSGICESCGPNEFSCKKGRDECIPFKSVCDSKPDCLLGEDELNCNLGGMNNQCTSNLTNNFGNASTLTNINIDIRNSKNRARYIPDWRFCEDGQRCAVDESGKCYLFCPVNCSCKGLTLNCSSAQNIPAFATSLTLYSLEQEQLHFRGQKLNLKKIQITSSNIGFLNIEKTVNLYELSIENCEITQMAFINDSNDFLRLLEIVNSTLASIKFSNQFHHSFELNIHNSSLSSTTSFPIRQLVGNKVNMIQTRGFLDLIQSFHHLVVNFSFCNLTELPRSHLETITLDLRQNKFKNCRLLYFTQILHLQHNEFEAIDVFVDTRHSEARLQYLDLSYNRIGQIGRSNLADLPNLLYLKLKKNIIAFIDENAFSKLSKLIHLDLSNNYLDSLKRSHFMRLSSLQFLDLQNNNLKVVEGMFDGLLSIRFLSVDYITLCCAQPKVRGKVYCSAPINQISSCDHLIDTPFLGILIWYIALFAVLGNFIGTFYRLYVLNRTPVSSFVIYSINLGVADFLMGVYIYMIAGANVTFSGRYGYADDWWRHSPLCTLAGVMATVSSEASALFVLLITVDRIHVIRFPFSNIKGNKLRPRLVSPFVWLTAIFLALMPLSGTDYFEDYYSSSGICISLPLSVQRKTGWEYSMAVFVGANFLIFVAILAGQIVIFCDVVNARKHLKGNKSTEKRRENALAKTLIAVAVTDMLCWIPIGVIGLLTFLGVDVTSKIYAWVVVVVLPINSALNPLIYTFSAIVRLGRSEMRWKLEKCRNLKTQDEFTLEEKT